MLYTFGECHTYGFNFSRDKDRTWPVRLSKLINEPLTDYSFPGVSNWRTARIISSLNLTKADTVIIAWADADVFEFGVNPDTGYDSFNVSDRSYCITERKTNNISNLVEHTGNITTKRFYRSMSANLDCPETKNLNRLAYTTFYNKLWFKQMFKVMYMATKHILEQSGCKWVMFNSKYILPFEDTDNDYFNDIHYIKGKSIGDLLGVGTIVLDDNYNRVNMSDRSDMDMNPDFCESLLWTSDTHHKISEIIKLKLEELYGDNI